MEWFKKIILLILMLICVFLPCESYQGYLTKFSDGLKTDFYCPENVSCETMLSQISDISKEQNVLVYNVQTNPRTMFYSEVNIYADKPAKDYIEKHYHVYEGIFSSLFSGRTSVKFFPFSNIPNEVLKDGASFSIVGTKENANKFKLDLIGIYGGNLPSSDGYDSIEESRTMLYLVWIITIVLMCFFTFYETLMLKKENFIRITLGESLPLLWVKFLSLDLLFILIAFIGCILFSIFFYNSIFMLNKMFVMLGVMILADTLVSVNLLFYDRNKVLAHLSFSRKLLTINSIVKSFTVILTVLFISTSLSVMYEYVQYENQKSFYELYSNYSVLQNVKVKNSDDVDVELSEKGGFYLEYVQKADISLLVEGLSLTSDRRIIRANTKAINSYVKNIITELQNHTFDKDIYLIYYDKAAPTEEEKKIILSGFEKYSIDEIVYHEQVNMVVRTPDDSFTKWVKNPIIIYYHKGLEEIYADDPVSLEISVPSVFFIIAENGSVNEYMNAHNIKFSITNMMDYFKHESIKLERTAYLSFVLAIMFIVLQIMILFSIIQLEYTVNAIELSIKKILGYSMVERFKKHYLLSFVLYTISLIAAEIISKTMQFGNVNFILYGILFMYFMENLIFTILAQKYDRNQIQKILKGGAL